MKNNIIKKLVSGLAVATIAIGTMSGCGTNDSTSNSTTNTSSSGSEVTTIYAATTGSPKPFTYVNDDNELVGHNIELIQAVFNKLPQYELVLEVTERDALFSGLDSDRYQLGVNNYAKNAEREEKYLFSDPMFENQYVAIVAADNNEFDDVESLAQFEGKSYIGSSGVNVTTAVENYNEENPDKQINVNYTDADVVVQLQDIESGKYDFLLMDKPMYEYYNAEYGFNLKSLDLSDDVSSSVMAEPYSFLLASKGNEELVADINKALAEVIEDGTSKEINEKYFGQDYTPYGD